MTNTPQYTELQGRVALITGGASGLGLDIAHELGRQGCHVYIADRDHARGVEQALAIANCREFIALDVRDGASVREAVARIHDTDGAIDILVNSAGVLCQGPYDKVSEHQWNQLLAVNLTGVFNCIQAVAPGMKNQQSGSIINVASVSAFKGGGSVGNVWYGASKAAVVAITQGISRELGPDQVRVNAIAPGLIETPMVREHVTPELKPELLKRFPMGRLATTADVTRLAVFLASDAAGFISGQTIAVDGGYLAT